MGLGTMRSNFFGIGQTLCGCPPGGSEHQKLVDGTVNNHSPYREANPLLRESGTTEAEFDSFTNARVLPPRKSEKYQHEEPLPF